MAIYKFSKYSAPQFDTPIQTHLEFIAEGIYSKTYPNHSDIDGIARYRHGAQHVGRVAAYIPILANLYRKYGDSEALALDERKIKLLQIAALFHDSGREADGEDKWDVDSATNFYHYARECLGIAHSEAKEIAEAMANKDFSPPGKYWELIDNDGQCDWRQIQKTTPKNIYAKLIHDADCLDIIRARYVFDACYLDFYKDMVFQKKSNEALNVMAKLITEVRSLIDTQGDNVRKQNSDIKKKYEHYPANLYDLIISDINTGCISGTNKLLRPFMLMLYDQGKLLSAKQLNGINLFPRENKEDSLNTALLNGNLFARGIITPSAIIVKPQDKINKLKQGDIRINETSVDCEIRKITRTFGVKTASGRTDKQGNLNRSVAMLGWGANTYCSAGFLVRNEDLKNIKCVSQVNVGSGYGKNKTIPISDPATINQEFSEVLLSTKLGGDLSRQGNYIATHVEIILNKIEPLILVGVFFSKDSNVTNSRVANDDGYALHDHVPILDAIHIQQAYQRTGEILPLYEYSGVHNFLQKREYTDSQILTMWIEMCEDYLTNPDLSFPLDVRGDKEELIEKIKILAMHTNFVGDRGDKHMPADGNYPAKLKHSINEKLKSLIEKYKFFIAVRSDDGKKIKYILDSLNKLPEDKVQKFLNQTDKKNRTVLSYVNTIELLTLLLDIVVPSVEDKKYLSRYFLLCAKEKNPDFKIIQTLLNAGVDIDVQDEQGNSALTLAAYMGHAELVKFLLERRADHTIQDKDNLTALDWATKRNHKAVIEVLKLFSVKQTIGFSVSFSIKYDDIKFGKEIGRGTFGSVYEGQWQNKQVAIKKIRYSDKYDPLSEFKREKSMLEMVTRLNIPNIVRYYGSCQYRSNYYIVMERLPHCLFNVLVNNPNLPLLIVYLIMQGVARGVVGLHAAWIVHGDIKLGNVLLGDTIDDVKLCDFGLAIKYNPAKQKCEERVGTFPAPEVVKDNEHTPKSDVYSVGVLFWNMLVSRKVYGEFVKKLRLGEKPPIPSTFEPKVAKLIKWCWARKPEARPTAEQVLREMDNVVASFKNR